MLRLLPLLILAVTMLAAEDRPLLHPLFTDHAVLQRGRPVPVWGWAQPGQSVRLTLAGITAEAVAESDGRWRAQIGPLPTGGPYELTVSAGAASATARDLLVGDVWLCSGQSNMQMGVGVSNDAEAEFAAGDHPRLRLCWVRNQIGHTPKETAELRWRPCTPQALREEGNWGGFSAAAYAFGRERLRELDVPIGLIHASWGGTPIQSWIGREALASFPHLAPPLAELDAFVAGTGEDEAAIQERWWAEKDPLSAAGAHAVGFDDAAWPTMAAPTPWYELGLADFDGVLWQRRTVAIPPAWAGRDLMLELGAIDDEDTTWFAGERVGQTAQWDAQRRYVVPGRLVTAGEHVLAVRILDRRLGGGVIGPAEAMRAYPVDEPAAAIPLSGTWRWHAGARMNQLGAPPVRYADNAHIVTVLANGMIAPLVPYGLAGFAWYQGESDAYSGNAGHYHRLLPALIADWRARFGAGLPFLIVQLSNFLPRATEPGESRWADLREAQLLTAQRVPATGLVVTIDIGDAADIHPREKREVGRRLALAARMLEDPGVVGSGPLPTAFEVIGEAIRVRFAHGAGLATSDGGAVTGFAIAGADGRFVWAEATIAGDAVLVRALAVPTPVAVRYAWADNPACNLVNGAGLPASPFRSDTPGN